LRRCNKTDSVFVAKFADPCEFHLIKFLCDDHNIEVF
jgi:hypothetical protein